MSRVLRTATAVGVVLIALNSGQSVAVRSQSVSALPWMNTALPPEQRANLLIAQMTLEQKVQQISNDVRPLEDPANRPPGCEFERVARYIHGIPELGIPNVRMTNGGTGLRGGACLPQPEATAVPTASAIGAAFNPDLARQLGFVLGSEARAWGHQVLLGPLMNLVRHPYGGRNFDFPSEDPYLTGIMSVETIKGIQAFGVHSVPKHIVGNEQETDRNNGNSVIPPRALHELYLLPFEMSAKDGEMAGVMCAYNQLNGVSSCSNRELLTTTLREQWGWQGYVVTDRRALHDLASSITAGVDWELAHETPHYYSLEPQEGNSRQGPSEGIRAALQNGSITVGDIDQMLRRRYTQMFKFGQFETNFDVTYEATPDFITHGLVAREIAEEGIVLLKNESGFLPLRTANLQSVALIGATWFAGMAKMAPLSLNGENANVNAPYTVTPKEGLENALRSLGSAATVTYDSGGGTGTQADIDRAVALARKSDVVIVMVGDNPYESCDLTPGLPIVPPVDKNICASSGEALPADEVDATTTENTESTDQEALIQALTADPAIARKMVVVLKTQGSLLMPWLPRIPALVEAWHPGQEDGNAVANVLFGLRNPSGKLPMTFGNSESEAAYSTPEQYPGLLEPGPPWSPNPVHAPHYIEDLQMGYRWYEANGVRPRFPFGFGLSYTTFAYSGLSVTPGVDSSGAPVLTVSYKITNTGSREGAEASQVYLTLPPAAGEPSKRLVGFQKVNLLAGETRPVTVVINGAASNHPFSYWVPVNNAPVPGWSNGAWQTASGEYTVHVGPSSAETPLVTTVSLTGGGTPATAGGCQTAAPGTGWACVNGGWLPPGHPLAAGGSGQQPAIPPPTPTTTTTLPAGNSSCQTPAPGTGWVCISGGWLPPGHPLAVGAPGQASAPPTTPTTPTTPSSTPSSCQTPAPGTGWVCVSGGWLPPGHPLAIGAAAQPSAPPTSPTTPSAPNATTSCQTARPGPTWVCVNGGWLPPGHPLAGGGGR
jgi:beta-glucosidase